MTYALILAAGQGTRLRPLTDNKPKTLVPLYGKSLLERQAKVLRDAGITKLNVATGYRADAIEALGFATSFNPAFESTNMVQSLFCTESFMREAAAKGEDLIIGYGDIVYEPKNLQTVLQTTAPMVLMIDKKWYDLWRLRMENPLDDAETLLLSADGYVQELGKKPQSLDQIQGQYTGLIKVAADKILEMVAFFHSLDRAGVYDGKTFPQMYMTSFIQALINKGWPVKAALVQNGWLEIDTVDDLHHYETMQNNGTLHPFFDVSAGA